MRNLEGKFMYSSLAMGFTNLASAWYAPIGRFLAKTIGQALTSAPVIKLVDVAINHLLALWSK